MKQDMKQSPPNELTQPELQFITKMLSEQIKDIHEQVDFYKGKVAHTWKYCIPNTSEAYSEFPRLNYAKDNLRKEQAKLKKLSEIQRKIKKKQGM